MSAPRVEVDLAKVRHNARALVERLVPLGIDLVAVTKAVLGSPEIADALVQSGVSALGDSRIENIELLRHAGVTAPTVLIRSPMLSQTARVVEHATTSLNSELVVIESLSSIAHAMGRVHGVILMVELGDLREGIVPRDLPDVVGRVLALPAVELRGIGTNLACQSGVVPTTENMAALSAIAESIETTFGITLDVVSGGNSANLDWALGLAPREDPTDAGQLDGRPAGRVNELRIGEAILLGREPTRRAPIDGLHTDAFAVVGEVIELKEKPSMPTGVRSQNAMGEQPDFADRGPRWRAIVALGQQDVDPTGLRPPTGLTIAGASSDHLVVDCDECRPAVGTEISFEPDYKALLRAMTSPFVTRDFDDAAEPRVLSIVPPFR